MYSHVFQNDSSSKSCSKLTRLVTKSFSLAVISTCFWISFQLVLGLRLIIIDDVETLIFRFFVEFKNPFGVCRKCLARWWLDLPSLETVLRLVFESFWSAVSVRNENITKKGYYFIVQVNTWKIRLSKNQLVYKLWFNFILGWKFSFPSLQTHL